MNPHNDGLAKLGTVVEKFSDEASARILKQFMRRAAADILNQGSAEDLREYIDQDYPLIENELPQEAESALRDIGPRYEDKVLELLTPEEVMGWLATPDWVDSPHTRRELQRCHEVIKGHPDGEDWLIDQIKHIRHVALDYPEDDT